jgi:hypothetical protein
MPDTRVVHRHVSANSLYGPTGPQQALGHFSPRPLTTKIQWPAGQPVTPQTIAEHLDSAIARVPGLSAKQRAAIHAVMTEKVRDLHFARLVAGQLGPQPSDEGRIL